MIFRYYDRIIVKLGFSSTLAVKKVVDSHGTAWCSKNETHISFVYLLNTGNSFICICFAFLFHFMEVSRAYYRVYTEVYTQKIVRFVIFFTDNREIFGFAVKMLLVYLTPVFLYQ